MAAKVYNSVELDAYPKDPLFNGGQIFKTVIATITIDASSADGDVVILARGLPIDAKVIGIRLPTVGSGITQLTSVDFGVYKNTANLVDGVLVSAIPTADVLDANLFVSALSFAGATAANVDILTSDRAKSIGDLLSKSVDEAPAGGVDICATINTQGSGTGTVEVAIDIAYPA